MRLKVNRIGYNGRLTLTSLFSVFVAWLPLFASYYSYIPGFSVADIILTMFVALTLACKVREKNEFIVKPNIIYLAMYLIVVFSLVSLIIQKKALVFDVAIRIIRYFFYLSAVAVCGKRIFDAEITKRHIKLVSVLATVYVIIQYFLYTIFGYILKGFVTFWPLYESGYSSRNYAYYFNMMFRPTSFFLEPAHFSRYAAIGIAICLFEKEKITGKRLFAAVFITIGVLISTSSQGYALLVVIWFIWVSKQLKGKANKWFRIVLILAVIASPIIIIKILPKLLQIEFISDTIRRTFTGSLADKNTAIGARLGGVLEYIKLPLGYKIIGMGFGSIIDGVWFSSYIYFLYGAGVIVFVLYAVYLLMVYKSTSGLKRVIFILFAILFITDDSFYSYMCIIFISLAFLKRKSNDNTEDRSIDEISVYSDRDKFGKRYLH